MYTIVPCTVTLVKYSSVFYRLLWYTVPLVLVVGEENDTFLDGVVVERDLVWRRLGVRVCWCFLSRRGGEGRGGEAWSGGEQAVIHTG